MRGAEIAQKLNISTSALRHYEKWGLLPPVERQENGYRKYTSLHETYFCCIRSLIPGFGVELVKQVLPLIVAGEFTKATWFINRQQVQIAAEKEETEQTLALLNSAATPHFGDHDKKYFSIGEVAKLTHASLSAIRHWEHEGLIRPRRDAESNFRQFEAEEIKRIFIIRTIQRNDYSLDSIRNVLAEVDLNQLEKTKKLAQDALAQIDAKLLKQFLGIAALAELIAHIQGLDTFPDTLTK
ncbi:MerR family DNA-binding transcriptional regulator [Agrilactobacillus yilanensis]|uniref:MerR family DNA-binding transcriptional regulator n=1 Tax=Agrilactobacillus yilanensis TaxID=2485997 RepID=A0ABW4J5K8_9LACO|nr:MerR family transcriptional regulator [Agrilactobacillus yilanensis]